MTHYHLILRETVNQNRDASFLRTNLSTDHGFIYFFISFNNICWRGVDLNVKVKGIMFPKLDRFI